MELGTGVAIAGVAFSVVAIIYRMLPPREIKNFQERCFEHSMIAQEISNIKAYLEKDIKPKLDMISDKLIEWK